MAEYRLSNQAKADLNEIADYTIETFGIEQARRYRDGLETCFQTLADKPMVGRSAAALAPALRDSIPCRVLQAGRPWCVHCTRVAREQGFSTPPLSRVLTS